MTVGTKRLAQVTALPQGTTTVYTAPTNFRTIVKTLHLVQNSGTFGDASFVLEDPAGHSFTLAKSPTLAAFVPFIFTGWFVLEAGDKIRVTANPGPINAWVSGTELLV